MQQILTWTKSQRSRVQVLTIIQKQLQVQERMAAMKMRKVEENPKKKKKSRKMEEKGIIQSHLDLQAEEGGQ